ncbi:MAG: HD-GYP domain-containing protein [Gemmatimonadaceae bacterium]
MGTSEFDMGSKVTTYVVAVVIAAVLAIAGLAYNSPTIDFTLVQGALAFALMGFVAQALVYSMPTGSTASIGFLPFLTAVVLYPSWFTVSAVAVAMFLAELRQKKTNIKRAFNVAQFIVSIASAAITYIWLGGVSLKLDPSFRLLPHSAAVTAFMVVNTGLVAGVIGLSTNRAFFNVWRQNTKGTVGYDLLAIPVVFWSAWLYTQLGWNGVAFVFVGMTGTRQFYQKNRLLEIAYEETLEILVGAVELRDPYTSGHSHRVRKFSTIIASALGLPTKQVERIGIAALLHDVGKIDGIFVPILQKPGKLTSEERAIMELHPIKSAELVARASQLADIVSTVRHHHENWNGTGYPDQLAGKSIPLGSRIIMFADTIDAMTTDRPYRKALGETEVRAELLKHRGTQFDPYICDALNDSPEFARLFDKSDSGKVQSLTQIFDRVRRRKRTPAVA